MRTLIRWKLLQFHFPGLRIFFDGRILHASGDRRERHAGRLHDVLAVEDHEGYYDENEDHRHDHKYYMQETEARSHVRRQIFALKVPFLKTQDLNVRVVDGETIVASEGLLVGNVDFGFVKPVMELQHVAIALEQVTFKLDGQTGDRVHLVHGVLLQVRDAIVTKIEIHQFGKAAGVPYEMHETVVGQVEDLEQGKDAKAILVDTGSDSIVGQVEDGKVLEAAVEDGRKAGHGCRLVECVCEVQLLQIRDGREEARMLGVKRDEVIVQDESLDVGYPVQSLALYRADLVVGEVHDSESFVNRIGPEDVRRQR